MLKVQRSEVKLKEKDTTKLYQRHNSASLRRLCQVKDSKHSRQHEHISVPADLALG